LPGDRVKTIPIPHPKLKPEQADNYSAGLMFDRYYGSFRRLQFESNACAGLIRDMMMIRTANY
jgi:hypothetical protein